MDNYEIESARVNDYLAEISSRNKDPHLKDIVEEFKKIILNMHRGIPIFTYDNNLEKLFSDKEIWDYFLKREIFIKKQNNVGYFLGINGMLLANNYQMEDLAKETKKLNSQIRWITWGVGLLTFLTLIASIINIINF
jgi:hypothetical protein